jgi:hypothetical protein
MMTNLLLANIIATLPGLGTHAPNVAMIIRADLTTREPPTETTATELMVTEATMLKTRDIDPASKVVNMHRSTSLVNGRDPATRIKKTIIAKASDKEMTSSREAIMMRRGEISSPEKSLIMGREGLITSVKKNLQMVSINDHKQVFSQKP